MTMSSAVFAGVLLLSICCATSANNGFKIPLERMESGMEKIFRQGADKDLVQGLYNMKFNKYFEAQYFANLTIGEPGRAFKVVLDTTWSYSWVPSKDCPMYEMACSLHQKYDHSNSCQYTPDGRTFDIVKDLTGYMSKDVFQMGDYKAVNQTFAEITKMPFTFISNVADGTLGLGLKDLSPMALPFVYNVAQQQRSMPKMFSFYIERDPKKSQRSFFGVGMIDYSLNKTAFTTVKLTSPYYWQFNVSKVSVLERGELRQDYCEDGTSALVDTSTNNILGPADAVKALNNYIGAKHILFTNHYWIPCKNLLADTNVTFTIANKEFVMEPKDYIQKVTYLGVTTCMSVFQPVDSSDFPANTWALGGAFLHRYYTAFDIDNLTFMIADIY